jgi:PAS domain S-box-containing protein
MTTEQLRESEVTDALLRALSAEGLASQAVAVEDIRELVRRLQREKAAAVTSLARERKARELFEATTDGLWDWDLTTNQVHFSPQWKATLGFDDHEVENNVSSFFRLLHPDDIPMVELALKRHFEEHEPYSVQLRMKTKSGDWRHILARGHAVWNEEGKAVRIAGTHTDITQRVEQERALLVAKEEQIAVQRRVIAALGCPVLQVKRGVLCVPLIGPFDRERAEHITEDLLSAVVQMSARAVIVDLTGAQLVDASSAGHIARVLKALKLLGARSVISGASPSMAKMMVEHAATFGDIPSYATLASALATAY